MSFTLRLSKRDFSLPLLTPGLEFDVGRYSFAAIGGPDYSDVRVNGDVAAQWQMINWLRSPAVILGPTNEPCWWGYVSNVIIRYGLMDFEISIDPMFNSVAVMYNQRDAGETGVGTRGTTAYSKNAEAVAEYGEKQMLVSLADMNETSALEARAKLLERWKYPIGSVNPAGDPARGVAGSLELRGWWETFRWMLFGRDEGRVAHEDFDTNQALGALNSNSRIKTTFKIPAGASAWSADTAAVMMSKEDFGYGELEDPTLELWSDQGGALGVQLATATIDHDQIPELPEFAYMSGTWDANPELQPDTVYHFVVDSHGPFTDEEMAVKVDEGLGYANGELRLYNVSTGQWLARSPNADLAFRISGSEETTAQMEEVYNVAGQFLSSFQLAIDPNGVVQDSGIFSNQFRNGDTTAMEEMLDLLATGRDAGNRYLVEITKERILRIVEEKDPPSLDEIDYWINEEGQLYKGNNRLSPGQLPVGFWMRTLHAAPDAIRNSALINFDPMFVEHIEYDTNSRRLRLGARDKLRSLDVASILREGR